MSHTKEPWPPFEDACIQMHPIHDYQAVYITPEDYIRARACVNACQGMTTDHLRGAAIILNEGHIAAREAAGEYTARIEKERDTYRELCAELLTHLKNSYRSPSFARDYLLESSIAKAEKLLGEKK